MLLIQKIPNAKGAEQLILRTAHGTIISRQFGILLLSPHHFILPLHEVLPFRLGPLKAGHALPDLDLARLDPQGLRLGHVGLVVILLEVDLDYLLHSGVPVFHEAERAGILRVLEDFEVSALRLGGELLEHRLQRREELLGIFRRDGDLDVVRERHVC